MPHFADIEFRAKADLSPDDMVSMWLIGFEDRPERSGEITVMEVFGRDLSPGRMLLGCGVKAVTDPHLATDFRQHEVACDLSEWHTYRAEWRSDGIVFRVDGTIVRHVAGAPDYPMQIMLGLYRLPSANPVPAETPASFVIDYVAAALPGALPSPARDAS